MKIKIKCIEEEPKNFTIVLKPKEIELTGTKEEIEAQATFISLSVSLKIQELLERGYQVEE